MATAVMTRDEVRDAGMLSCVLDNEVLDGFERLKELASEYPGNGFVTVDTLNGLVEGTSGAMSSLSASNIEWQIEVAKLIAWWTEVQNAIGRLWLPCEHESTPPGQVEANAARKAMGDPLAMFLTSFEKVGDGPFMNFFRAYRLWTRSICQMGRKGWPGVDWSDLEKVV